MHVSVGKEVAVLERMTVKDLRAKYAEVWNEQTNANNKGWLVRRIAWRLQALAEGDLSERARQRAAELARDSDVRTTIPRQSKPTESPSVVTGALPVAGDRRLPPAGTVLTRKYKGTTLQVLVLPDGFVYADTIYPSLSAVAKAITGSHCNGFLFFRLNQKGGDA
jgi:hypothetical protein